METSKQIQVRFLTNMSLELADILLEVNGKRILIDPGRDEGTIHYKQILPYYELPTLDMIVLTHFHGDHSNLMKDILETQKFKGKIICHEATTEIVTEYYNLEQFSSQFISIPYGKRYQLFGDNFLTLYDAGHVLGSSMLYFELGDKIILITGDLGANFLPVVREATTKFSNQPIDLLVLDAKQADKPHDFDTRKNPLGNIIYQKLRDCFLFDYGNILIYAPLVQIPLLMYCLNYIFHKRKYRDVCNKITAVYLDPQPKLRKLLEIYNTYDHLLDRGDIEYIRFKKQHFRFPKLEESLPQQRDFRRSIIITPNRNVFVRFFEKLKHSEENDVLLFNNNIHFALKREIGLIDHCCNIQIKRVPFLHFHKNLDELIQWCKKVNRRVKVKQHLLYHYKKEFSVMPIQRELERKVKGNFRLVHQLSNCRLSI